LKTPQSPQSTRAEPRDQHRQKVRAEVTGEGKKPQSQTRHLREGRSYPERVWGKTASVGLLDGGAGTAYKDGESPADEATVKTTPKQAVKYQRSRRHRSRAANLPEPNERRAAAARLIGGRPGHLFARERAPRHILQKNPRGDVGRQENPQRARWPEKGGKGRGRVQAYLEGDLRQVRRGSKDWG